MLYNWGFQTGYGGVPWPYRGKKLGKIDELTAHIRLCAKLK